jgi:hypothetical protein
MRKWPLYSIKLFLSIFFSALLIPSIAQVTFDKGYIIDNEGKKIECHIKNKDRLLNPLTFQYKLSEDEQPKEVSVQDVKEVEIYNYARYVSTLVEIDTSISTINHYSSSRAPEWRKKTIFLKVLVDGKASLYSYRSPDFIRFFFKTEANPSIRQLIYKEYTTSTGSIGENVIFKQQLFSEVNCGNIQRTRFERMNYRLDELKEHFIKYDKCMGGDEVSKKEVQSTPYVKRNVLNFTIAPGFNSSSLTVNNENYAGYDADLGGGSYFRLGLQIEYVLPFERNKWSVFIEPTYQTYNSSKEYYNSQLLGHSYTATVDYSSFEFPLGVRRYFFLKGSSKIFLNVFFVPNATQLSNSSLVYNVTYQNILSSGTTTETEATVSLASSSTFGAGIGCSGRLLSLEVRYYGSTDLTADDSRGFVTSYRRLAIIVGFRFLSIKK